MLGVGWLGVLVILCCGVWGLAFWRFGVWCLVSGAWCLVLGVLRVLRVCVCGLWFVFRCLWFEVCRCCFVSCVFAFVLDVRFFCLLLDHVICRVLVVGC